MQSCIKVEYRVTKVVAHLGWVDLDLGSSPGKWAATVATYCPSQMVQHSKYASTQLRSATTFVTLYTCRVEEQVLKTEMDLFRNMPLLLVRDPHQLKGMSFPHFPFQA